MPGARQWNEGGHAIVHAAFALDFEPPPTARTIREILALHPKLRDDFPRKQEFKGRRIGFPAEALGADIFEPEIGEAVLTGFTFDTLNPDGTVKRSIALQNNGLKILRADYETWERTWGEVREVFALLLPLIMEHSGVTALHLEYLDRFVWEGDAGAFRSDMVFRRNSQLLTPHAFEAPELWHSFHGYFHYPDQPEKHQLLNVVEARLIAPESAGLPPEGAPVADIKLTHRAVPGRERANGGMKPVNSLEEFLGTGSKNGTLDEYMNEMHDADKWLLAHLINDELCEKIRLPHTE